jgi:hypothetical protein
MRTGRLIVGVISYLAIGSFVLAQTAASVIRGTIQDATGAVLPDVHVTLRDETRNQSWTQTTNEDFFGYLGVAVRHYTVEVEHPRFKKELI